MVQRLQHKSCHSISDVRENMLEFIGTGSDFLNKTPRMQAQRQKINKWDLMKLKSSVQQRASSLKRSLQKGKKSLSSICLEKDLYLG